MTRPDTSVSKVAPEALSPADQLSLVVEHATDISLTLTSGDVIQGVTVSAKKNSFGKLGHWAGRRIYDFLEDVSAEKLRAAFEKIKRSPGSVLADIELNHVDNASWEFPVLYTLVRLDTSGGYLMLGRDLRPVAEVQQKLVHAQLSLEKDYEINRQNETRFRVLLTKSRDPFILFNARGVIFDYNSAAADLLGLDGGQVATSAISEVFENGGQEDLLDKIIRHASSDAAVTVRTRSKKQTLEIHPTAFRSAGEITLLCRLESLDHGQPGAQALTQSLHDLYTHGCEGVVFTNASGVIQQANSEFLSLCDLPRAEDAKGKSLAEFLVRGGVDLKVLLEHTNRSGRLRIYSTQLKSPFGALTSVEISAVHFAERRDRVNAFVMRAAPQGDRAPGAGTSDEALRDVMELVGSAPLKDLVASTADVVERMCIETAVQLTGNNRVAAAELLGLSRQGLYIKLRKYGLLHKNGEDQS